MKENIRRRKINYSDDIMKKKKICSKQGITHFSNVFLYRIIIACSRALNKYLEREKKNSSFYTYSFSLITLPFSSFRWIVLTFISFSFYSNSLDGNRETILLLTFNIELHLIYIHTHTHNVRHTVSD